MTRPIGRVYCAQVNPSSLATWTMSWCTFASLCAQGLTGDRVMENGKWMENGKRLWKLMVKKKISHPKQNWWSRWIWSWQSRHVSMSQVSQKSWSGSVGCFGHMFSFSCLVWTGCSVLFPVYTKFWPIFGKCWWKHKITSGSWYSTIDYHVRAWKPRNNDYWGLFLWILLVRQYSK